jgi:hypothetical protein
MASGGIGGNFTRAAMGRREWLRLMAGGIAGPSVVDGMAQAAQEAGKLGRPARDVAEAEIEAARAKLTGARIGPINVFRTTHYQAIGDAPEGFLRLTLGDCEQLAQDFDRHFKARGFRVHPADRRLTVVGFRDDRSFRRFFPQLSGGRPAGRGPSVQRVGNYSRSTNMLYVFDWRMVPMEPRSGHRNTETLAHEGIHQLSYNTGLLGREWDIPLCIVEGIGLYGEARQVTGASELGRINLRRLEDLARTQRMIDWIPLRELFTDDSVLQAGKALRVLLAYAQSWLLVHYLMKQPEALPKFRNYLEALSKRRGSEHRIDDIQDHLGDVNALDRELRGYAVRLQRSM